MKHQLSDVTSLSAMLCSIYILLGIHDIWEIANGQTI